MTPSLYFLLLFPAILLVAGSALENALMSLGGLFLAIGFVYIFSGLNPAAWVIANPVLSVLFVGLYFLAGALWSWIKFGFWLDGQKTRIAQSYAEWQSMNKRHGSTTLGPEDFKTSTSNSWSAANNKQRIMGWLVWWLPSLFWTATHDLFQNIWKWVYNRMVKLYEAASNRGIDKALK